MGKNETARPRAKPPSKVLGLHDIHVWGTSDIGDFEIIRGGGGGGGGRYGFKKIFP